MTQFIEIRITILVDIFEGIKKHCEKRTHRNHQYQDSKDFTFTPRNVECFLKLSWPESEITNLSKNGTLPILTCELGLLVIKFVLNHFFSSVEQNGVQIFLSERLSHLSYLKFKWQKFISKYFTKGRNETNVISRPYARNTIQQMTHSFPEYNCYSSSLLFCPAEGNHSQT